MVRCWTKRRSTEWSSRIWSLKTSSLYPGRKKICHHIQIRFFFFKNIVNLTMKDSDIVIISRQKNILFSNSLQRSWTFHQGIAPPIDHPRLSWLHNQDWRDIHGVAENNKRKECRLHSSGLHKYHHYHHGQRSSSSLSIIIIIIIILVFIVVIGQLTLLCGFKMIVWSHVP